MRNTHNVSLRLYSSDEVTGATLSCAYQTILCIDFKTCGIRRHRYAYAGGRCSWDNYQMGSSYRTYFTHACPLQNRKPAWSFNHRNQIRQSKKYTPTYHLVMNQVVCSVANWMIGTPDHLRTHIWYRNSRKFTHHYATISPPYCRLEEHPIRALREDCDLVPAEEVALDA